MFEIIGEVEPTRSREKLEKWIPPLRGLLDWIDVPESPLGVPRAHSVAVAAYIQERYGIPGIAHVRVSDVNLVAFKSLVGAAVLLGVTRLVALRGDPPSEGGECGHLRPEDAIGLARSHGLGAVEVGVLVSARRAPAEISARLRSRPDFAFILNSTPQSLRSLVPEAQALGVRIYPYLVVETERNRWLTSRMPAYVPRYSLESVPAVASELEGLADGVVLSVPADYTGLAEAARLVRRMP